MRRHRTGEREKRKRKLLAQGEGENDAEVWNGGAEAENGGAAKKDLEGEREGAKVIHSFEDNDIRDE